MKYFCTLSDIKYLTLGLCLHESLVKTTKDDFILYYLCLDDESYNKLIEIDSPNIKPISVNYLKDNNMDLAQHRPIDYRDFACMLASYFSDFLMRTENIDHITYIDSDIYLYEDIQIMYDEIGDKSVGIIRHRQIPIGFNSGDGSYNVGIVYFKNDQVGRHCLFWWKDAVMYHKYPRLATCYDQKYLEGFLEMYTPDQICVADETFAHSAPWHHRLFDWSNLDIDNTITWEGKVQKLLFCHFSRITYSVGDNQYLHCGGYYNGHTLDGAVYKIPQVNRIHDEYFEVIKRITTEHQLQNGKTVTS